MNTENHVFSSPEVKEHPTIEQFKKVNAKHRHLEDCFDEIRRITVRPGTSGVVILTGPTGSGKTHLARRLFCDLRKAFDMSEPETKSLVPVVGLRAVPPRATAFDWQDFFIRLLEQLRDFLVDKKLLVPTQLSLIGDFPVTSAAESMKVTALRRSVEKALRMRKTRVMIVDEAHHILMCKDPDMQRFIFEQLKSLTDETGIILVLVGTYDLLDIRDHSGQLMRRSMIVHLQRYDYNDVKHRENFGSALRDLTSQLPIPLDLSAMAKAERLDFFYIKSAGCIGILRDLLLECLRRAVEDNMSTITLDLVNKSVKANHALATILTEARKGERRLVDIDDSEIRELLTRNDEESTTRSMTALPVKVPKKHAVQGRVAKRSPGRDLVQRG